MVEGCGKRVEGYAWSGELSQGLISEFGWGYHWGVFSKEIWSALKFKTRLVEG